MDMDKTQDYACEVKERAAQPVLAVRTRTAVQGLPQVMGDALGAVMAYLGELGEHPAGPPYTATPHPLPGKIDFGKPLSH